MRIAYLDESGIGPIEADPYAIMAGVIVTADVQWKALDKYLQDMRADLFPGEQAVSFHATDIWQGSRHFSGKRFRDKWPRRMLLLEICQLTQRFDLPVVFGSINRAELNAQRPDLSARDALRVALAICAAQCTACVERYMRNEARAEVAMVVYENNDTAHAIIREVHNYLRDALTDADFEPGSMHAEYFPLRHVVDTAHFAAKADSGLLQVADAVAYAINRKLKNAEDCDYLFDAIDKQLIVRQKTWV